MSQHFSAFSFVDQVTPALDSSHIEGRYVIPSALHDFPPTLAAEAIGQLAAWAAMKATNFERRPIAGLAGKIDLPAPARAGQVLRMAVDIESVDSEAVAYHGSAAIDGTLTVQLEECVGPMVPVADLDEPAALRERFELLCGPGAAPGAFQGLPPLVFTRTGGEKGLSARAMFQVPASAAFFADHFPRRPVFPGSLLIQLNLELAATLAAEIPPPTSSRWRIQTILGMKLREFIPPGKCLELEARLTQRSSDSLTLALSVRADEGIVASARLRLVPKGCQ